MLHVLLLRFAWDAETSHPKLHETRLQRDPVLGVSSRVGMCPRASPALRTERTMGRAILPRYLPRMTSQTYEKGHELVSQEGNLVDDTANSGRRSDLLAMSRRPISTKPFSASMNSFTTISCFPSAEKAHHSVSSRPAEPGCSTRIRTLFNQSVAVVNRKGARGCEVYTSVSIRGHLHVSCVLIALGRSLIRIREQIQPTGSL
jgi:hypothetical protein